MTNERCKTVIVYGDHGPEEREPVEDYYAAPQQPAGEAGAPPADSTDAVAWLDFCNGHSVDEVARAITTPADSAPLVEAIKALSEFRDAAVRCREVPYRTPEAQDAYLRMFNDVLDKHIPALAAANGGA